MKINIISLKSEADDVYFHLGNRQYIEYAKFLFYTEAKLFEWDLTTLF